jgi:hypothetical protein
VVLGAGETRGVGRGVGVGVVVRGVAVGVVRVDAVPPPVDVVAEPREGDEVADGGLAVAVPVLALAVTEGDDAGGATPSVPAGVDPHAASPATRATATDQMTTRPDIAASTTMVARPGACGGGL